jgi:hypothetical protein
VNSGSGRVDAGLDARVMRAFEAAVLLVYAIALIAFFRFTAEDSYIVARYAENLVDRGALEFNPGERVSALTSPLHALLESALYAATGETLLAYKLVALLLVLASVGLVLRATAGYALARVLILPVLLLSPCMVLWTVGGLDAPLLLFWVTLLSVALYGARELTGGRLLAVHLLVGLAFVTRHDSILFTAPCVAWVALQVRDLRRLLPAWLVGAAIPAAWLAVAWLHYGDLLPTSFYIKAPKIGPEALLWNAVYVAQYLLIVFLIPGQIFWFLAGGSAVPPSASLAERARGLWWLYAGLGAMLLYALGVATAHMMFSFRCFVPYLPASVLLIVDLARSRDGGVASRPAPRHTRLGLAALLGFVIAVQGFQLFYTYRYSINGVVALYGEYRREGLASYADAFMPTLVRNGEDIRRHWATRDESARRPPRIHTFAEGILPYTFREAYIYGVLVSHRHDCVYASHISADYFHLATPRHGSLEEIVGPHAGEFPMISSQRIPFDGEPTDFVVLFNPRPYRPLLPARVDAPCLERPPRVQIPGSSDADLP